MAFLTEAKVAKTLDIPVALPATEVRQGDWLVVATLKIAEPMRLTYQFMTLQMLSSSVDTSLIVAGNKVSPALDLAFIGLYRNYSSGHPGLLPALDIVKIRETNEQLDCVPISEINGQFITVRSSPLVAYTTAGVYSFIVANNTQASTSSTIPITTSIDFILCATGQIRLELEGS